MDSKQSDQATRETKAQRRERAQAEREALRRRAIRKRRTRRLAIAGGVLAVVAVVAVVVLLSGGGSSSGPSNTAVNPRDLPGIQTGTAPWPAEEDHLKERLDMIGLPAAASMTANIHHHDLLQVVVHRREETVPAQIGINEAEGFLTSLHTHDASGILHVESPDPHRFTLGEAFDVWGVLFTRSCIGGYCASGQDQLRVYVNGEQWPGNPRDIPLAQHQDIVVTFGTQSELPNPIPSTYSKSISETCAPDC